jgi:hypothetical protein
MIDMGNEGRSRNVSVKLGDRIMAIDVLGMSHGDMGTVIDIQRERWYGNRLLVSISPDKELPHYACGRQGKSQWQNLSR